MSYFIVLEGSNGSGKSTMAKRLRDTLVSKDIPCLLTQEPSSSALGEFVREMTRKGPIECDALSLLLMFLADRKNHVTEIANEVRKGTVVISDRYTPSTYVYQYLFPRNPIEVGSILRAVDHMWPVPDLTFILTASASTLWSRLEQRARSKPARFETLDTLRETAGYYTHLKFYLRNAGLGAKLLEKPLWTVDTEDTEDAVFGQVLSCCRTQLGLRI